MSIKSVFVLALCCVQAVLLSSCSGESSAAGVDAPREAPEVLAVQALNDSPVNREEIVSALDLLAGTERSSGFRSGMGLAESRLREEAGDYAGAVMAAFKELFYAYGAGSLGGEQVRAGLEAALSLDEVHDAALAALAFFDGRWKEAAEGLDGLRDGEEPDSFVQWMFLASLLESGLLKGAQEDGPLAGGSVFDESRRAVLARYSAIRARYSGLAAYWYHLAIVSGEGAERCVDIAPLGPYAGECRKILAESCGLRGDAASALRTRAEIERAVSGAAAQGSAALLEELFPLLALEDNPFTLYALGALNALSASPLFRNYLAARGRESSGRLEERLRYITGGAL
ncbi:MAG: hypothetical protein LBK64_01220 [Spirochaetaceae bacterium]|nr:hypothetical protein [Spirochaetaceae bacterium]